MQMTLAERLAQRRKALKLKQTDVARASGIAQSLISAYETGEAMPAADKLVALAAALDTTPEYLLGLTDVPTRPDMELSDDERKLVDAYRTRDLLMLMELVVAKMREPQAR